MSWRLKGKEVVMKATKRIVVVLFFCSFLLVGSEISMQDIPVIPNSTLKYSQIVAKEWLVAEYWVFLPDKTSFQEQLDQGRAHAQTCVKLMQDMNWRLTKENRTRRGGEFSFKKEIVKEAIVKVGPGSKPLEGKQKHYIFIKFEVKRLIPFEDVTGYDYPDVPRYPGSIRIRWMDLLGDYGAKYLVMGSVDEVKKFYEKKLLDFGWQPGKGAGTLNYLKGGTISKDAGAVVKKNIKKPIKMVTKLIPTTLSIHLAENEGIVNIGIGRSAGGGDTDLKEQPPITPIKKLDPQGEKPLTFIDHEKDIPLFPGLTKKHVETFPINVYGQQIIRQRLETGYVEPKTAINMAKFYLEEMKKRGWELNDDEWGGLGRRMLFIKGAVQVKTAIKAIGRYPIPESTAKRKINIPLQIDVILPIPLKEMAGKDIKGVPRFPGSVRYYYLEVALDHVVRYKVAAAVKEVECYYLRELPKHDWTFSGYDSTGLLFVPGSTAKSAAAALAKGKLIPTTLKLKVDNMGNGIVKFGFCRTRGD